MSAEPLVTEFLGGELRNPLVLASGIVRYGREYDRDIGLKEVGGVVTKTVTPGAREGNPAPRITEVDSGMLNSIGLENPGFRRFIEEDLPFLKDRGAMIVVSIASPSPRDLREMAAALDPIDHVDAVELNLSCPNVSHFEDKFSALSGEPRGNGSGGHGDDNIKLTAQGVETTYRAVAAAREGTDKPLIAKLSPAVTDIVEIGRSAVRAGADALSLINTLPGVKVNVFERKFALANVSGGLSGPAIRPVGVKMVYDVKRELGVPVIAHGGVKDHISALEYIMVGADLVAVGSALFKSPGLVPGILKGLRKYLDERGTTLDRIRGELL